MCAANQTNGSISGGLTATNGPSSRPSPRAAPDLAGVERRVERLLRLPGSGLESFDNGCGADFQDIARHLAARLDTASRVAPGWSDGAQSMSAALLIEEATEPSRQALMEAERLVTLAQQGISHVKSGVAPGALDDDTVLALEAIISVTDRPSLPVRNGVLVFPDPPLPPSIEFWVAVLSAARDRVKPVAVATGVLLFDQGGGLSGSQGTVWRLGENFVVTNRHVAVPAMRFDPMAKPDDPLMGLRLFPDRTLIVDFAHEHLTSPSRYVIEALVYIEPEEKPDLAVFSLKPWGGTAPPAGLPIADHGTTLIPTSNVFVIGHPAVDNLNDGQAVTEIFGDLDGSKRLSPGKIMDGSNGGVLLHDCSTVGGSSGSPVVDVVGGRVIGLHYFGQSRQHNEAVLIPGLPSDHFIYRTLLG
jgi:glutamyl endopeptidase